jgi:hypothetical protein
MAQNPNPRGGQDAEQAAAAKKANAPEPLAGGAAPGAPESAGASMPAGTSMGTTEQSGVRPTFTPAEHLGGATHADPLAAAAGEWRMPEQGELDEQALGAERARARSRGVAEEELATLEENTVWVVSNLTDDRTVPGSFERDPRHPSGEAIVGGSTPVRVFMTPNYERLKLAGLIMVVPPPRAAIEVEDPTTGQTVRVRNRKMPVTVMIDPSFTTASQPGHPTPIGRRLDEDLWNEQDRRSVLARQRGMPAQIPVPPGGIVPRHSEVDRPA